MDNLITVVSLQGQAWAVAQDGSRRELKVGDTVAGDEMVVTADGAQIDLQFASNQILTLIGEQDAPVDVAQFAEEAVLSQPLAAINTEQEPLNTAPVAPVGRTAPKDGHGFVQLVRIGELIESDGFTALTVARIQEIIKPLGMVLPERDFALERWKEHAGGRELADGRAHQDDSELMFKPSVSLDVIAEDDIINAAEAARNITVTGTVGDDVKPGDKVIVTVNGKAYGTTVSPDGKTWGVDIPGSELVQDKVVQASVTSSTPTGKLVTADTERSYEADTDLPVLAGVLTAQRAEDADELTLDISNEFTDPSSGSDLRYAATDLPAGLSIDAETGIISGTIDSSASQAGSTGTQGEYSVIVTVTDPAGNSSDHSFTWTVSNPAPVAADDAGATSENAPLLVVNAANGVLSNDTDPDGDTLTVIEVNGVAGNITTAVAGTVPVGEPGAGNPAGSFILNADGSYIFNDNGDFEYLAAGETAKTEVTYTVSDGEGGTDIATLTVTVTGTNDAPIAVADLGATDENTVLTVAADGVLSNDTDPDATDNLVVSEVAGAAGNLATPVAGTGSGTGQGLFTVNADGSYSFDPNGEFEYLAVGESETSTINYTVSDGQGGTSTTSITVTISGVNNTPTANGTLAAQTNNDADVVSVATSAMFADADASDTLTYSAAGLPAGLTIDPATGIISGTIDNSASQSGNSGTKGVYNVVVTATDNADTTATQSFNWTVTNPAPVAADDAGATSENAPLLVVNAANGVLSNDTDPDGDTLTVSTVNGIAGNVASAVAGDTGGLFTIAADGSYTFTDNGEFESLAAGETRTTSVDYEVSDGEGGTDTATLTITVTGTNDAPTANGTITAQTDNDADVVSVATSAAFADADTSDTLTYSAAGLPAGLTIDPATGIISGTIDNSASQSGNSGTKGVYNIVVTATDDAGATATQSFDWTVTNPAPVAVNDSVTVLEDQILTVSAANGVLGNDYDPDGDTSLTVTGFAIAGTNYTAGDSATIIGVGELTLNSDGSYVFKPAPNYNGSVPSVTYIATDTDGSSDTAELNITVAPVLDITLTAAAQVNEGDKITLTAAVENVVQGSPVYVVLDNGQTITIPVGSNSGSIDVDSRPDDAYLQGTTSQTFEVISASGGTEAINSSSFGSTVTVEIVDADSTVTATLTVSEAAVDEGAADLVYTVTLEDSSGTPVVANNAVTVVTTLGTIVIAANSSSGRLTVAVQGDDPYLDGETVTNAIASVTEANADTAGAFENLAFDNTAVNTVVSDTADTTTATLTSVDSGDEDNGSITYSINLDNPTQGAQDFTLELSNGQTQTITVAAGSSAGAVTFGWGSGLIGSAIALSGYPDSDVHLEPDYVLSVDSITASGNGGNFENLTVVDSSTDLTIADTIDPVYAQISVNESAVIEGGTLTYTVNLIDANGDPVTVAAGKNVTINLAWTGVASAADVDNLPASVTIGAGVLGVNFNVVTKVDGIAEYSESLIATIGSVQDNDGLDKGFENLQISGSKNSATSNILDAPTITAIDGNGGASGQITVYEKGLGNPADTSETATGTLRVTAVSGLTSIEIAGQSIDLATLQNLPQTITIAGHGELTLTSFTPTTTVNGVDAAWDIGYSYKLTDAQAHAPGAGANDLLKDITLGVTAGAVDSLGSVVGSGNLGVLVIDDGPTAVADSGTVTEGATLTVNAANGVLDSDKSGADGWDSSGAVVGVVAGTSSGGTTGGVGGNINGLYGTLTLNADGSYTYESTADAITGNEQDVFTYTVRDADGDLAHTTLTIDVANVSVPATSITETVNESGITDGTAGDSSNIASGQVTLPAGVGVIPQTNINTAHGVFSIDANGNYSYTLTDRTSGDSVTDSFTYTTTDANGNTVSNTVTIDIIDDTPIANTDTDSIGEGATLTVNATNGVLSNDQSGADGWDVNGAVVGVQTGNTAANSTGGVGGRIDGDYGHLTLNADGSYTYVSTADAITADAQDVFTYTVRDADGDLAHTTLTIDVANVLVPATSISETVNESGLVGGSTEGDNSHISSGTVILPAGVEVVPQSNINTAHGVFSIDVNGNYTYTLSGSTTGDTVSDSFTYTTKDALGNTVINNVVMTIVDDEPTALNDTNSLTEDDAFIVGNVIAGDTDGGVADTVGADGATITAITNSSSTSTTDANGNLVIQGEYGKLTIKADGSYKYELDNSNPVVNALKDGVDLTENFTYTLTDGDGDTSTAQLDITINGRTDGAPSITPVDDNGKDSANNISTIGHITVKESGLMGGSTAGSGHIETGSIDIATGDGLAAVTVAGTTITLAQLQAIDSGDSSTHITITSAAGELTLTDFDSITNVGGVPTLGKLHFSYELTTAQNTAADSNNPTVGLNSTDGFALTVTDAGSADSSSTLVVNIIDDVPVAANDASSIAEDGVLPATGNVTTNDTVGADGADVTAISSVNAAGNTATNTAGVLEIDGAFGTLTINPDGSYSYTLDNSNLAVQGLSDTESLTETFTYTLTDGDGDTVSANLDITINGADDGVTVTVPVDVTATTPDSINTDHVVFESGLAGGSAPSAVDTQVVSSFSVAALDGLAAGNGVSLAYTNVNGQARTLELSKAQVEALATQSQTIDTQYGEMVLNGYSQAADGTITINYNYTLERAPQVDAVDSNDNIVITATDRDGDTNSQTLGIKVVDDAPTAVADVNSIAEDAISVAGNVVTNDTVGADGADVSAISSTNVPANTATNSAGVLEIDGAFGTLTINPDGSYTYVLDNSNLTVQGLSDTQSLTETFSYTLTDGDTDADTANLVITINGTNDGVSLAIPVDNAAVTPDGNTSDQVVFESGLAGGSNVNPDDTTVVSSFTLKALDGLDPTAAVTINYTDNNGAPASLVLTKAQVENLSTADQTLTTQYGELVLNGYTQAADGTITVDYVYTLINAPAVSGTDTTENFGITVTDKDTSAATQNLDIKIVDDAPKAITDTNSIVEDAVLPATGNVITNDTVGADGADVTAISSVNAAGNTATNTAGVLEIDGAFGTLTINPDGSYSYALDNNNAAVNALKDGNNLSEVFNYTLTDGDGDTSTASLTIAINGRTDGAPSLVPEDVNGPGNPADINTQGHITVKESGLVDATGDHTGSSFISINAADGLDSIVVGGQSISLVDLANLNPTDSNTHIVISTPAGTLTLTNFANTTVVGGVPTAGELHYNYELVSAQNTPVKPGDLGLNSSDIIAIEVKDAGGDSVTGQLEVNIIDDTPTVAVDTGSVNEGATLTVSANDGVLSNDKSGADGWNAGGGVVGVVAGNTPGTLDDVTTLGTAITGAYGELTLNADGSYSYVANANAVTQGENDVFTYTVKDADGDLVETTLTINVQDITGAPQTTTATVDEAGLVTGTDAGNGHIASGNLSLDSGWSVTTAQSGTSTYGAWSVAIDGTFSYELTSATTEGTNDTDSFTYTSVDQYGNTVSNTVNITITDDVPTVVSSGVALPEILVTEAALATSASANFTDAFTKHFGADGVAATDSHVYSLVVDAAVASGLTDTTTNKAIDLVLNATTGAIEGMVNGATDVAFTIVVDNTGKVTLTQSRALKHGDTSTAADLVKIAAGAVSLKATVKDGDGDTASTSVAIGDRFVFQDDGPSITAAPVVGVVDEKHLTAGSAPDANETIITTNLHVDFGNDGAVSLTFRAASEQQTLRTWLDASGNETIDIAVNATGDVLTATRGASEIFTVSLTINASGQASYAFELKGSMHHNSAAPHKLTFNYQAADGDNDKVDGVFTVNVIDDVPVIAPGASTVKLEVLEANIDLITDPLNPVFASTSADFSDVFAIAIAGADGGTITYGLTIDDTATGFTDTTTGQTIILKEVGGVIGGYTSGSDELAFTVGIDTNSGEVTLTQQRAIAHPDSGKDKLSLPNGSISMTVNVTDGDGDTATANANIGDKLSFEDDAPTITPTGVVPTLTVDETDLTQDATADFSSSFAAAFGADGAATANSLTYALSITNPQGVVLSGADKFGAVPSGIIDTATGNYLWLFNDGGVIVARVGGGANMKPGSVRVNGDKSFELSVDSDGKVTLNQFRSVKHSTADPDEALTLPRDNMVRITATAVDGDGDSASHLINIGKNLSFKDDGPSITAGIDTNAVLADLVTKDAETLAGTSTANANFAGAFVVDSSEYGADGNGGTVWAYNLGLQSAGASVASGLTTGAAAITLYLISGQVIGSTATTVETVTAGNTAFTITVSASGVVTLTQKLPIDHANSNSSTETIVLVDNLITLTGTATITDRDGDKASDSKTIEIGEKFVFTDDGPTVGRPDNATVDEANLTAGSATDIPALTKTGSLAIGLSADGVDTQLASTTVADFTALGLTSGGTAISYALSADGYTLTATAGANTVFTATITNPAAANADYEFVLSGAIDHVQPSNDTSLDLPFNFVVTDKDGDTATGSFEVTVVDDVPVANDQAPVDVAEGAGAIGYDGTNWSAGTANLIDNDKQGADGATVHQIRYADTNNNLQVVAAGSTVTTQYGELTVNAGGTWAYTPDASIAHSNNDPVSDLFSYNLIDTEGDISGWADQPINVADTAPVAKDDTEQSIVEGATFEGAATSLAGDVIGNDTSSADGTPTIYDFVYTDAAGASQTHTFVAGTDEVTFTTPTGDLKVNKNGEWEFTPVNDFNHAGDESAGSFTYRLVDDDGSVSTTATQPIVVTDTNPTVTFAPGIVDEQYIKNIGSAGKTGDYQTTFVPTIVNGQDTFGKITFSTGTTGVDLTAQNLTSGGIPLVYSQMHHGSFFFAHAGVGGPLVFQLNADQNIKITLFKPLDHTGTSELDINIRYKVSDSDSSFQGNMTIKVIDDVPTANEGALIDVAEGGNTITGALLTNDKQGADKAQVYDITYTDTNGDPKTALVDATNGVTVTTQFGELTVNSDGSWSYTSNDAVHHDQLTHDDEVADNFGYRLIDGDGDISNVATQKIDVLDTVPVFDNVSDNTVTEANFASGSNPDTARLVVNGDLTVTPGKDTFDVTFDAAIKAPAGLKSRGVDIEYVLSNDDHTLIAYRGAGPAEADKVFTAQINDPTDSTAGYTFTLHDIIDHGGASELDLVFGVTVTDSDGDTNTNSFIVKVEDDTSQLTMVRTVDEDGEVSFNTSADATPGNTTIYNQADTALTGVSNGDGGVGYKSAHGTVTVNADGTITYKSDANYSGDEVFIFKTNDGTTTDETTVTMTVTPVADAPTVTVENTSIVTNEDVAIALGLKTPIITDDGTGSGNNPVSERIDEITLEGFLEGAKLLAADGTTVWHTFDSSGSVSITLTDGVLHTNGASGDLSMSFADFEALQVLPPAESHTNFTVTVKATSYEVDGSGVPLVGVAGAESSTSVQVNVQAVTDPVDLKVNDGSNFIDNDSLSPIAVSMDEDTAFNLASLLQITLDESNDGNSTADIDGSEERWFTVTGLPVGSEVNEHTITAAESTGGYRIEIPNNYNGATPTMPTINVTAPKDFSGDIEGVKVTLHAQDHDSDGIGSGATTGLEVTDSVYVDLHVNPIAGDVEAGDVTTPEDTAVDFLKHVRVTDTGTTNGTEVIDSVAFEIPTSWQVTAPTNTVGWSVSGVGTAADPYTITFNNDANAGTVLNAGDREAVLDAFTITPPAHSSLDATIELTVTSTDTNPATETDTKTVTSADHPSLTVKITVTPVAEEVGKNSDGANGNDVTINASHVYGGNGTEDVYFTLGTDTGFNLGADWSNEDGKSSASNSAGTGFGGGSGSEDTYALFTPYETVNNDAQAGAAIAGELNGSYFQYTDGAGVVHTLVFNGTAVKIPVQYLDTVQFKGSENFKGVVKIKVQAGTIDYDEDNGTPTDMAVSGESWLTNIVLQPLADQVTLTVNARITTDEDVPFALNIKPSSSDTSETFNVTIKDIPAGASVTYTHAGTTYVINSSFDASAINGLTVTANAVDGTFSLTMNNFDVNNQPMIAPPKDSNEEIKLKVEAASVDTLTYIDANGTTVTAGSTATGGLIKSLDVTVTVNGVPDEPVFVIDNTKVYEEGVLDKHELPGATDKNQVNLSELITQLETGETTGDGSETVTLRLSGLPEGFDLNGAGSSLGGTGETRLWVINQTQLGDVKIQLPVNYSGTVSFTAQPVVTENDNDSGMFASPENISFKVNPTPEATLNISSDFIEDTVGKIDFSAVHQNGDTDEFISAIQIKAIAGVTFYSDAAGTTELTAVGGYYEVSGAAVNSIYAKGLPNFSGTQPIEVQYKVTDTSADSTLSKETDWQSANHDLIIKAVTDEISAVLNNITAVVGAGDSFNYDGTKTATVTGTGTVTVKVHVNQSADSDAGGLQDTDGSEQLTHITISGVPEGVSVEGAIQIGLGQWLITTSGDTFTNDTLSKDVVFNVTEYAGDIANTKITITSYTKDMGADSATSAANIQKAEVDWNLTVVQGGAASNDLPDVTLQEIQTVQTEDVTDGFALNTVVGGTLANGTGSGKYDITVTLRSDPNDETEFKDASGDLLTRTEVIENFIPVVLWTQSISVAVGDDANAKLSDLLSTIKVHAPEHANSNNLTGGKLPLDVTVSVHADGVSKQAEIEPQVDIKPVTDETTVTVQADPVGEGDDILLNITLDNQPDGTYSTITGSIVTVELGTTGLVGDLLYANGTPVIPAVPGGNIYEIGLVGGQPPQLTFKPDANQPHQTGSLTVNASVTTTETGAASSVTSSGSGVLVIEASNSGFAGAIEANGTEQAQGQDEATQLIVTEQGLNDPDEIIDSAFINGLPPGFTVYYGADKASAVLASNAGLGADGNNTWSIPVVSGAQALPGYIAVLPPKHWSGSLSDLTLTVMSGESGLTPTGSDIDFSLVVAPVADGVELNPTLSFGKAGDIIDLNLNAAMKDPVAADATNALDAHSERTTLEFSGFTDGKKMLFFIDGVEMATGRVVFDSVNETHTITGLTQAELDGLGFQHLGTGGVKDITVTASTQEVDSADQPVGLPSANSIGTVQINVTDKLPTIGDDTLLWTGSLIDGRGGEDTIQLRFDESITSSDLATNLKNIEVLDLTVAGANTIGTAGLGLSIADVLDITDSRNELTIDGDGEDKVFLDNGWATDNSVTDGYVVYTYIDAGNSANNVTLNIAEHIIVD